MDSKRSLLRAASWVAATAAVLALPFWLLVRGSVLAHELFGASAWGAILLGAAAAVLIIATVLWWVWRRLTGHDRFRVIATRVVLPSVVCLCVYTLLYVSSPNLKTPEMVTFYHHVHPILRVALGTLIVLDSDLVITDFERKPDDYQSMGLPSRPRSLHYKQKDGWVYAVDLRTQGRGFVRNGLMRLYFFAMGFDTLRHDGSADHLHVSLPP